MKKGRIIILSGPSGSGKTTLDKMLLKSRRFKGSIVKSVSVTTRPSRPGERDAREYYFVTKKMFFYKRRAGHFLESKKVFNEYYGTPKKKVEEKLNKGKNVLLSIDVKGAAEVRRKCPGALTIFVKTPSFSELEKRLRARATENKEDMKTRLRTAKTELRKESKYDYVIVNDVLKRAYNELEKILSVEIN